MRLIDADTIPYTMLYKENWLKGTGIEEPGVWKDTIDAMPTIEAEPVRRGKWIKKKDIVIGDYFECSLCKNIESRLAPGWWNAKNFCPHCGARMEVEE